jgi:hypothetical protein
MMVRDLPDPNLSDSPTVTLTSLLSGVPCIGSIDLLQGEVGGQLKMPFDTDVMEKQVLLPYNIDELVRNNYLVRLYTHVLNEQGYKCTVGTSSWNTRLPKSEVTETYLKAFGILIVFKSIPVLPKNKGVLWKGIATSIRYLIEGRNGVDLSLFKVKDSTNLTQTVLGESGKNYPVEKKMLDHLVHYVRSEFVLNPEYNLKDIILPAEQIIHDKGLSLKLDSELVTPVEHGFIRKAMISKHKVDPVVDYKVDFGKTVTFENVRAFQKEFEARQKVLRDLKGLYKMETSRRVQACFAPYKGVQRKKAQKIPIRTLKEEVKGTSEWAHFNPTGWLPLIGETPLTTSLVQSTSEEKLEHQFEQLAFKHEKKDYYSDLLSLISEFKTFSLYVEKVTV